MAAEIPSSLQTLRNAGAANIMVSRVATGLTRPRATGFLPEGRMPVTEKPGRMVEAYGAVLPDPIAGTREVWAEGRYLRGDAFTGSLVQRGLLRVEIEDLRVAEEEFLPLGHRIRDVAMGSDGAICAALDREDGAIWKIQPRDWPGAQPSAGPQ